MYISEQDYLMHHGVKGMKWGVRKDNRTVGKRVAESIHNRQYKKAQKALAKDAKKLPKAQAKWDKKRSKISQKAVDEAGRKLHEEIIPKVNQKYTAKMLEDPELRDIRAKEINTNFYILYDQEVSKLIGYRPTKETQLYDRTHKTYQKTGMVVSGKNKQRLAAMERKELSRYDPSVKAHREASNLLNEIERERKNRMLELHDTEWNDEPKKKKKSR